MIDNKNYEKFDNDEYVGFGKKVGLYNLDSDDVEFKYIVGNVKGNQYTLVCFITGQLFFCTKDCLYKYDYSNDKKMYLNFDQESMIAGNEVVFETNTKSKVYIIEKINTAESCDLKVKDGDVHLRSIPLAYLKFANSGDSVKEDKLKEKKNNKKEKNTTPSKEKIKVSFKIEVKANKNDIVAKCSDDKYGGICILKDFVKLPIEVQKSKIKEDVKNAIVNAYEMYMDEDRRKRTDIFIPKEGDHYCRFIKVGLVFNEENIEWAVYNKYDIKCIMDLELGNMYRDGHEARSDYNRLKNDISQRSKQIIENRKKTICGYEEED